MLLTWAVCAGALDRLGQGTTPGRFDAIVVLGCAVDDQGAPSPALKRRVEAGAALFHAHRAPILVLTGGRVRGRPAEAPGMAAHAVSRGVPTQALLLEDQSRSTRENAAFTARLIPGASVLIVTDAWHLPRARRVFGTHFPRVGGAGVNGPARSRAHGALREVPVWIHHALT